jgi:16S rRNA (guanine966-N2)-methyltransferase
MTATRRSSTGMAGDRGRNRVRIIAGKWRSRVVKFPATAQLRPTPDRVRETLFNWLGQRLDGLSCLDLFAGSGALGFEALSRGAERVVMVEQDRAVAAALREAARLLDATGAEVVEGESMQFLKRGGEKFDLAFIDPPYAGPLALQSLALLPPRLHPGARVYVESAEVIAAQAPWRTLREDRAGAVRYALFELASS